jgi:phage tail sheath protein FI
MPPYQSPGIYVEEVPPMARPIAGVGTSTAGFIGLVPDDVEMPNQPGLFKKDDQGKVETDEQGNPIPSPYPVADVDVPKLITSWEQFKNNFGDFQKQKKTEGSGEAAKPVWTDDVHHAYRQFQHAVYGFFNNGGTRCWVMRVNKANVLTKPADSLKKLAPIDEIALVAIPGATTKDQQDAILTHCMNAKDRFAILDGVQSKTLKPGDIAPVGRSEAGSYGAVYFPRIMVSNFVPKDETETESRIAVPPSGHLAGIYARSDSARGVHKAPANEVILGALGVETALSKADQDGLNPEGINVIRAFNGSIKVWGARTLTDDAHPEFRYVSTRRFFNFARESIDEGTQWVIFEPNTPKLWQSIKRNVGDFLLGQWRIGALFGETPEKAFFVKCDADTNPPDVRELGQVVTEIGVAITKPAEFVIFRVQQITGG